MKRVTGIGGVFFKSSDPDRLRAWYRDHLGIDVQSWGGCEFQWTSDDNPGGGGSTTWSPFKEDTTKSFGTGGARFMINYRVADLHALLAALREEGCAVEDDVEESEYGKFGWVADPDGNRIELWQPPEGR